MKNGISAVWHIIRHRGTSSGTTHTADLAAHHQIIPLDLGELLHTHSSKPCWQLPWRGHCL